MNLFSSTSTSSSTASDEDLEEKYRKKRKWKDYFRRLTRQVLAKQEEMQKRFLEAIEKREREQVAQEDAWRMLEMARINREHEILVQERSTAAAKDAAVIAFLQKLSGQQSPITQPTTLPFGGNFLQQLPQPPQPPPPPLQSPPPPPPPTSTTVSQVQPQQPQVPLMPNNNLEFQKVNNGHSAGPLMSSSSRWPKAEVHALIMLRTSLEAKYQDNGPKAPLWEDISAGMQRLGYNRSAKRCKEKWENINKYFKKVKEGKKQRREDSKTCPYFHELDALYKEKNKSQNPFGASFHNMKPNEMMEPLMVQPEQQWRPPLQYEHHEEQSEEGHAVKDNNNNACHQHEAKKRERGEEEEEYEEVDDDDDDDDSGDDAEDDDGDSVEDEGASPYEIVTNKLSSVDTVE